MRYSSTPSEGGQTDEQTGDSRRSVLRRAAGVGGTLLAGGVLGGTASAGELGGDDGEGAVPEDFPVITTRGHFDGDGNLTAGNTRTNYGGAGDWGKYDRQAPDDSEIVVVVHGYNNDLQGGRDTANRTRLGLRENGYGNLVVGFAWDADASVGTFDPGWGEAVDIARGNGPKLAQWVADWTDQGGRPVRVIAHSLGARVTAEALADLRARGRSNAVRSVALLGGAIDDQEVETDEPYGAAIADATHRFDNFYNTDDPVLDWAYSAFEFDTAVGQLGIQDVSDSPANYGEADVTDTVDGHSSYYRANEGCLPQVVATF